VASIILTMYQ